ncbi:MAG TPA: NmrA/HSCARG family protein, partial [Chitinophagaceae bacterium]|nr:NmrA/HSCARG family protein [Chitinophagaceae bacterium]
YRSFGFPGAEDLGNMFQFYRDFENDVNGVRDVSFSKQLNPELKNFSQWLDEYSGKIPLE